MTAELSHEHAAALRAELARRHADVLALTRALVETESPSGDEAGSRAVVALLADAARRLSGMTAVERLPVAGYGEHLRVQLYADAPRAARTTLLLGHTDTVHPRGSLAARPWRESEGRVYGPGIFDMKVNCALALAALDACAAVALRPPRPVVLLLTCDEEAGSNTGRALVEAEAARAAHVLVLEPSAAGGRVKTGRKGTGMYTLAVTGRAAHAGLDPEKGVSAILELARQIERLHALTDFGAGTTVNVGVVAGGTRSNVVAAEARAEIDVRFTTNAAGARLDEAIKGARPFDERTRLTITGGINRPPLERTREVAALYERARRVAALLDYELGETQVGGASDGNFAAAVCAAVLDGLGVAGDGAHADHEHVVAADIAPRAALLAALIATL
ncbi:MAG TPA: M20/M25/M40 family metallo-hydrolase [Pyrinomonadaceae bacterium]|jgi:glutamate carboxypeptidase